MIVGGKAFDNIHIERDKHTYELEATPKSPVHDAAHRSC